MDLKKGTSPLCAKGCGFYGSKENKDMCSKCYNDFLKTELLAKSFEALDLLHKPPIHNTTPPNSPLLQSASSSETTAVADSCAKTTSAPAASGSGSSFKNRCKNCNKKVGLTGFKCRCGHLFCGVDRYPNEHACAFDFKNFDRKILFKNNPLIKTAKLEEKL